MARKKTEVDQELLKQQKLKRDLEELVNKLKFIPSPTYSFQIGDAVTIGNLKDVTISDILHDGKIYELTYTHVNSNYGDPIETPDSKRYSAWMDIRPLIEVQPESLIKNADIRMSFQQNELSSLFSKVYHFGVNFDPEYQRDYVWQLEDKESLIDSIFNNVEIGKFAFIRYDDEKWTATGYSYEVLDGKQRMRAILDFYEDRFTHKGKKFSELSIKDRNHFKRYTISVAEVSDLSEEQILRYFIKLNTSGKVMEKEHVEKVRQMLDEETQ
ncbi:hypothetical protein BRE01_62790 [Brevibacillus reuszeri]|uniref:GmrSD restriction endonucleases N-terminal domain-containing protein n=1 Tax=Brevibacillus reuszeri TaxID=54915 RepID=A0A0K9YXI6_9BACL|nr:DUF262 domain-containing protein [Brevibacillus reuszeri]KNB72960.1 hypothetical protein ADS79_14155 [Brevibacillus reuszeri]GED72577.1 hypothetical protein BRE01_62790 [Brevibacillus reuszeri]